MRNTIPASLDLLLKDVSRSFYLTLRVLPSGIRPQIGLAYLLARATDTIADTDLVGLEGRMEALHKLRERILGRRAEPVDLSLMARQQGLPAERILLQRIEEAVGLLNRFEPPDRERIRSVVETITSGQELDLRRFGGAAPPNVIALETDAELEDYTYRVAGCVGEFWTRMCCAHLFKPGRVDEAFLLKAGLRFGQGLQLVNILRDLPADFKTGRCYIPSQSLARVGLKPSDLLNASVEPRFKPLYLEYLLKAELNLAEGWAYTNALPRACPRIRLACAWPLLIGQKTIQKLRVSHVLDGAMRIKITRPEIRSVLVKSIVLYPFKQAWRNQFAPVPREKGALESAGSARS
jgi:farnesyl-diphosphate farnesyltransferase